ncbi:non-homologous end-joining DNA ligase [Arsenicicoccus bolidensis]|uniref:Non-homologous end-joining DNA ligase n=1 Tax=Arsenicicoccus bolidensis TaxID=229480 RepID=A0ABS9PY01_9MICO|nr:non-homologous end-joining DNA ligase [Arsenicicoccus bolidensis]MCG7320506.1 non-homologous end-joining DNA ligase [Arsenicicoccus bolidensis]
MPDHVSVEIDGRTLRLSSLDKVLYPETGTTKGEVLQYYAQVAPVLLEQLRDRAVTRIRWPSGTGGPSFFEKNVPRGTPAWIRTVTLPAPGSTRDRETITYPVIDSVAGLTWLGNLAALELHVHQWRVSGDGDSLPPDRLVVDLDPGPGAGLAECAQVAMWARDILCDMGLDDLWPVTSGSKGLQLYVELDGTHPVAVVREVAQGLAVALEAAHPSLVVSSMAKVKRGGKVLVDWSQNTASKTTICPWSLRGKFGRPTVAAPREWSELEDAVAGRTPLDQLSLDEALARLP